MRVVSAFLALAAVMVGNVLLLRTSRPVADAVIVEDGPIEYLGALALFTGAVLAALTFRRRRAAGASRWLLASLAGLALVLFAAGGEEISWGQRILGISTPEAIARVNVQGEINLHNLYGDDGGQNISTPLFMAFWVGFGVLVPLAALLPRIGGFLRRHVPVLPLWLAALFVGQQLLWKPVQAAWRADPGSWLGTYRSTIGGDGPFRIETVEQAAASGMSSPAGLVEIMEANVQILLCAGALWLFLQARRERPGSGRAPIGAPGHGAAGRVPAVATGGGAHRAPSVRRLPLRSGRPVRPRRNLRLGTPRGEPG